MSKSDLSSTTRTDSFVHVLIGDVTTSLDELNSDNTPTRRRSAIRTTFSSIEGLMHLARGVLDTFPLTPAEFVVVKEVAVEVTERGAINERPRSVPFDRSLKAIVRIVGKYRPDYALDFDHPGWSALLRIMEVRHRLTHPKKLDDLAVSDQEIEDAHRGFSWFLAFALEVMAETVDTIKDRYEKSPYYDEKLSKALEALESNNKSDEGDV